MQTTRPGFRPLPSRNNHNCFGCSPVNPSGLQMTFHTDGQSVRSWITVPAHLCGWNDIVHGGVVATMLDEIMSWSAIYLLGRLILTRSMTIDFLAPVMAGKEIAAKGELVHRKNEREAQMAGFLYDPEERLCARATGVFALFTPEALRAKGMLDAEAFQSMQAILTTRAETLL